VLRCLITVVAVLTPLAVARAGVTYEVVPIGGAAYGMNNHGVVVGSYNRDPFSWTAQDGLYRYGLVYDNWAFDVNDLGIMVGHTKTTYNYGTYSRYGAFAYDVHTKEKLPSGAVALTQWIAAVSNLNTTAGQKWLYDAPNGSHYGGQSYHLDAFGDPYAVSWGEGRTAQDISDRNIAVGADGRVRTPAGWTYLPTAGATVAMGINDLWNGSATGGFICGKANNQPVYWDAHGNLHALTMPEMTSGSLRRVNDHGQMVGSVYLTGIGTRAAVYRGGELANLNDLLAGTSYVLVNAMDINDRGQIVANASGAGAVLLNPVYLRDGQISTDSLTTAWSATGPGSADVYEHHPGDLALRLTAGSPVTITQDVSTPDAAYTLSFDYQFLSTDPAATLDILLDGLLLGTLAAPDTLAADLTTHNIGVVASTGLLGLDDVPLDFTYDGPTGTQVLIDNVVINQVLNMIPEPASLCLLAAGALLMLPGRIKRA